MTRRFTAETSVVVCRRVSRRGTDPNRVRERVELPDWSLSPNTVTLTRPDADAITLDFDQMVFGVHPMPGRGRRRKPRCNGLCRRYNLTCFGARS